MIKPSSARVFAPSALHLLMLTAIACSEPSGAATTADVAPVAHGPADAEPEVAPAPEPATEPAADDTVLAAQDPATASPGDEAETGADIEPPEPAAPIEPKRVLIVGSSLAATGFGAVLEDKLDAHPNIDCYRKAKSASGLARPDFFDWDDQSKRQVEFRKPDLVIVFMGANDGQDIPPWRGSSRVMWGSEDWSAAYRTRVDDFLTNLTTPVEEQDGAHVMWLGLPKMPSPSLERKLTLIRGVHEQAVQALGDAGIYLDTTPYLVDEAGQLLRTAKVRGKDQELRSEDGVHFTMSGCEFLADKIYPEVLTALGLPAESSE